MSKIERPGVDQRWLKRWKAVRANGLKFCAEFESRTMKELEHYVQHGAVAEPLMTTRPGGPTYNGWEVDMEFSLSIFATIRQFQFEMDGMNGNPFNSELARHAFEAMYVCEMIGLYKKRTNSNNMTFFHIPYIALGAVAGESDAFQIARLQLAAHRERCYGYSTNFYPVFHFLLRIMGDYLDEPPMSLIGESHTEPIHNLLFDLWRSPDPDELAPVCLAACDFHTHRGAPSKRGNSVEFGTWWTRTPISVLLLFKLRQLLGLPNPDIDHPLMNSPLGKLPEKDALCEPNDLIRRVRERMMQDGYDENEIADSYKD